jgi:uncharacterized surface anchored protein
MVFGANENDISPLATIAGNDIRSYYADPSTASITDGMTLTYQNSNGDAANPVTINSTINFNIGLDIPAAIAPSVQAGDYYNIVLPDTVTIQQGVSNVALYDDDGVLYGTFDVIPDTTGATGGTVHIVFTNNVHTQVGGLTGSLYFQGNFSKENIDSPGTTHIVIPDETNLTADVDIKPETSSTIEKSGIANYPNGSTVNPTSITWTVLFNKALAPLDDAIVTDTFPSNLILTDGQTTVQVEQVDVDLYGNLIPGSEQSPPLSAYNIGPAPDYTVTFPGPADTNAYKITYTTPIDTTTISQTGGAFSFTNNATGQTNSSDTPQTATSTVKTNFGKLLEKVATSNSMQTVGTATQPNLKQQTFNWVLRYNYNNGSYAPGDPSAVITDVYDPSAAASTQVNGQGGPIGFNPASLIVYPVSYVNGSPVRGTTPVNPSQYTVTQSNGTFEVTFINGVNSPYDIVYQTYVVGNYANPGTNDLTPNPDGVVVTSSTISNTASTDNNNTHSTGNSSVKQQGVVKKLTNVNVDTDTLSWQATINAGRNMTTNLQFFDVLTTGQVAQFENLVVHDVTSNRNLVAGTDYQLDSWNAGTGTDHFEVSFLHSYNPTDHEFTISYSTSYSADPPSGTPFVNQATTQWYTNGTLYSAQDTANYTPSTVETNNGYKNGSYNAVDKIITWDTYVGFADTSMKNATFTDQIVSPSANQQQTYVPMSLHVYHYTETSATTGVKGSELTPGEYSELTITDPSPANNNTIFISFPDTDTTGPGSRYLIEYQTSLVGQDIAATYTNDVVLHNDNSVDHDLTASVTPANGGKLVTKSGKQATDGYIYWTVNINPSQSTISNVVVHDVPRTNTTSAQTVVTDSIQVVPGIVDQSGNITPDTQHPLINGTDYTWIYAPNAAGNLELTLQLIGAYQTITQPYILTYRSSVMATASGVHAYNDVTIDSNNSSNMDDDVESYAAINVTKAGGVLIGALASFTLNKTTDLGIPMDGVVFRLFDSNGNVVGVDRTTDANGKIVYNGLVPGSYHLVELTNGGGKWMAYSISDDLVKGLHVTVTAGGNTTVTNAPGIVRLHKVNETGAALSGAAFILEMSDGSGGWIAPPQGFAVNYTSDANGLIELVGLPAGNYRFTETKAPDGYITNTVPIDFSVGPDRILPVLNLTSTNLQGTIWFTKVMSFGAGANVPPELKDAVEGQPLPGATFYLYDGNPSQILPPAIPPNIVGIATSDVDGRVEFTGVPPLSSDTDPTIGYWIREEGLPTGFAFTTEFPGNMYGPIQIPDTIDDPADAVVNPLDLGGGTYATYPNLLVDDSVFFYKTDSDNNKLSGAIFDLYGPDDFTGTPIRSSITTNSNGLGAISGLLSGAYRLIETQAPDGFLLNTIPIDFTLTGNEPNHKVMLPDNAINYQGSAIISKSDPDNNKLSGATFTVYDSTDTAVTTAMTSSDGIAAFTGLGPGTYTVKETIAPEGYLINSVAIPSFTVPDSAAGEPLVIILNNDIPVVDYQGSVVLTKEGENSAVLAGADFRLYGWASLHNGTYSGSKATDFGSYTTDRNGKISVDGLAPGRYFFVETNAPKGYLLPDTDKTLPMLSGTQIPSSIPNSFTVSDSANGEPGAVKITVKNKVYTPPIVKTDDTFPLMQIYIVLGITLVLLILLIPIRLKRGTTSQ